MGFENIIYAKVGVGIAKVTLNRPEAINAYTLLMLGEMAEAFAQAKADSEVRTVILTGAGRGFCAGADLRTTSTMDFENALRTYYRPMIEGITGMGKPVIAMVNGVAAGAGMSTTLACDFRVAATNTRFVTAFSKIGLVPDAGMSYHLPRLIGIARAQEMISLNRDVSGEEAVSIGLATKVVAPEELEKATLEMAHSLANTTTLAFGITRQMLHSALQMTLDEALAQEEKNQAIAGASEDFKEGVAAFMEKRAPNFKGK